ncbi:hypothetical protein [Kutzneria sp. NPDC052558]|uniref:hypothetical protein n=1 Tax=Kutzneria sp. NPDC052558 TaxID=3364121 RepID=UPI0037CC5ECD
MIESVEVVVAALSAGAAAGLKDTASTAVKEAYQGLKVLTQKALRHKGVDPESEGVIEGQLEDPQQHQEELRKALVAADAGSDAELVAAAQRLLALTDPEGSNAGKYRVNVHHNQGVSVGDGNTLTMNFGPQS